MIKNLKNILSNLNTRKCFLLRNNVRTGFGVLKNRNIISLMSNLTCNTTKLANKNKIMLNFLMLTGFFFEPLEQFEIVDNSYVLNSKLLSAYSFITYNHTVPFILFGFFYLVLLANTSVYSNFFIIHLLLFRLVRNLFSVNVPNSSKNQKSFFLFYTVFGFILYHNLSGMVPFTYTVTSLIVTSFLLSSTVFFSICTKNVLQNGWFFFDHFLPVGVNIRAARWMVIIELISFFIRVISLGVRLFANLLSGHILLKVLIGFFLIGLTFLTKTGLLLFPGMLLYFFVLLLVTALEVFISFLQAYTFVFLTIIYFSETTKILELKAAKKANKVVFLKPNLVSEISFFFSRKNLFLFLFFNAPKPKQAMFQEAGSHMMEEVIAFHNDVTCFLIFIVSAIVYLIGSTIYYFYFKKDDPAVQEYIREYNATHNANLEIIWTSLPALVLLSIVLPSFVLLYMSSGRIEALTPPLNFKIAGNQWYWTYEYVDAEGVSKIFDSYLTADEDLPSGGLRGLQATSSLIIPIHTKIRFLVVSNDIIHSWSVPGLGIKVDACPGRINEVIVNVKRRAVYMGQCSEICGKHHGNMPTVISAVYPHEYYYSRSKDFMEEINQTPVEKTEEGALTSSDGI